MIHWLGSLLVNRLLPPTLVLLLCALLLLLWLLHPETMQIRAGRALPWDIPLVLGAALLVWARVHFARRRAEIHTFRPPTRLITDGPFRLSRNPMYLGMTLIVLAAAMATNLWCALLVPLAFWALAQWRYIPHEEAAMFAAYGDEYAEYTQRTRRWL